MLLFPRSSHHQSEVGVCIDTMHHFATETPYLFSCPTAKCSVDYKLPLKYLGSKVNNLLREKPSFPWALLHPYRTTAKKLIITDLESSWVNTASNWISSFILNILFKKSGQVSNTRASLRTALVTSTNI